ncbi:MAG TPA: type VII secretion-associated serine protease mycosin [Pseudonocardiaceae bacterium]|nr:type VII secretion-associated serine protease mycosin [Pseudonocardiaceae bacterium]
MSRTMRVPYRIAATSLAALVVLLGPAAWPAYADGSTPVGNPPVGPSVWEPPPLPANAPLPNNVGQAGSPDNPYTLGQNAACIKSGVTEPLIQEPPAQDMLNIADAQKISTGKGVTVAVIDTGVYKHPMFGDRLINGGDYIQGDGNALQDCDGHGTIVAGIIAADTRGTPYKFIGVAPDAKILAIRQTDGNFQFQNPSTNQTLAAGDLKTLGEAIVYAASQPDVKVITMSVDNCNPLADALIPESTADGQALQAAIRWAVDVKDKVVVAAAGNIPNGNTSDKSSTGQGGGAASQSSDPCSAVPQNDNPDPNAVKQVEIPPAYADNVLSVASVNPTTGNISPFSEWGPWVSVAAPGEQIISVDPAVGATMLTSQTVQNNQVTTLQGTSFAAPYVAGLAALIRAKYPNLSARQVMYRIEATAQHPSGPEGRNNQVGYGIINPVAALTALIPGQNGVPEATTTSIRAQVPNGGADDALPMRVALIGIGGAALVLLAIYFVVRTSRDGRKQGSS